MSYKPKDETNWDFEQLAEPYAVHNIDKIIDLNALTLCKIVAGTHPEFRLVTFDN